MTRPLGLIALLFLGAAGAAWLAERPGTIRYEIEGFAGTLTAAEAAVLVGAAILLALVATEVLRAIYRIPRTLKDRRERRRRRREEAREASSAEAMSRGLIALGTGDARTAADAARTVLRETPDAPLGAFLAAQSAQLQGDRSEALARFEALSARPQTALLGLRGLSLEAERAGDRDAAAAHARSALSADPAAAWAHRLLLGEETRTGDFDTALARVAEMEKRSLLGKAAVRDTRLALLTARALQREDRSAARKDALEAHALAKDFVPAALAAARALSDQDPRRAAAILADTFKRNPHPELFRAALDLAGPAASERLERAKTLAALRPDHVESALGLSRAALAARDIQLARDTIEPHLGAEASQRVLLLMAELEAVAPSDEGRVRALLARVPTASTDPVWFADGTVLASWAPISPHTHKIGAVTWQVPPMIGRKEGPALDLDRPLALSASERSDGGSGSQTIEGAAVPAVPRT
ncbi:MAG: heme biosynthesis HemY N-terminal domain-containing protein [Pseudomonadota bacterium]